MTRLATVFTIVGMLAWSGCSGDPTVSSDPFAGKWSCSEHRTIQISSPAGTPASDTTVMTTLVITSQNGVLTASNESDGAPPCRITFNESGSVATLIGGQTCQTTDGITLTYKSGTSTLKGSTLDSTLAYDAAGAIAGGTTTVSGTGTTTSTCSRISAPPGGTTGTGGW